MPSKYFDYTVKVMRNAVLEAGRVATWANGQESNLLSAVAAASDQTEQRDTDAQVLAVWEDAIQKIFGALEEMYTNMQAVDVASDPFGDLENRMAGSDPNPWMIKFGIASPRTDSADDDARKMFPKGAWKAVGMLEQQMSEADGKMVEMVKQLNGLVEYHTERINSAGIDAIQALQIASVLAGGGRVHAFGDGFVEVQNGMGEIMTFYRGDDTRRSNPASDADPKGDSTASHHGSQARVWISPTCPPPMRQILTEIFGDVDGTRTGVRQ
ncbi:MAG: hypothetical protein H7839_22935 [Magnetococcus sp. YQC-5]